jgi:hypothetical protein
MRYEVKAHEHEAEFETMTRAHDYLWALGYRVMGPGRYVKVLENYPGFRVTTYATVEIKP